MLSRDFLPNIGGIAAHVYELSKALVHLGNQVYLVKPMYGSGKHVLETVDGIQVHRLKIPGYLRVWRFSQLISTTRKYIDNLIAQKNIKILHWHTHDTGSLISKSIKSAIPRIFTNHTSTFIMAYRNPLRRSFLGWMIGHADHIITPSRELLVKSLSLGFESGRATYIPNGVDPQKFHPKSSGNDIRDKLTRNSDEIIVLCPRRIVEKNGIIYLARAIPQIKEIYPPVRVVIVGSGDPRVKKEIIEQLSKDGNVEDVIFTGSIPNSQMPAYYSAADLVVLPSLIEATSIAGLEAMASGKPLVGTRVGGLPAIIDDGKTGILVNPRDPKELANAIGLLVQNPEMRRSMGRRAAERANTEFTWKKIAERVSNVYQVELDRLQMRNLKH